MTIKSDDLLIIGRGNTSYKLAFGDLGLASAEDIDLKVDRTGDTMLGDLSFNNEFKVKTRFLDSGQNTNLTLMRNGEARLVLSNTQVIAQKKVRLIEEGTDTDHAMTKSYIDGKVKKSGDTMSGVLTINNSANPQLNFNKSGNNDIQYRGSWVVSFQSGPVVKLDAKVNMNSKQLYNLKDPENNQDAATMKYVDDKVASINAPNLSNYATKTYVDNAVNNAKPQYTITKSGSTYYVS